MIATLSRMLGLAPADAEASMYSERAARAVLSRRDLLAAGGALAAGTAFSFVLPRYEQLQWYAEVAMVDGVWEVVRSWPAENESGRLPEKYAGRAGLVVGPLPSPAKPDQFRRYYP